VAKQSKKVALVGSFGVGKTSLFRRFIDDTFSEGYQSTLGVQIQKKVIPMPDGTELSLILWDYLLGSHAFVYVFDLTRLETFKNINTQIDFLKEKYPNVLIKVVGNKLDAINEKHVSSTLKEYKVDYDFLTSAKTGDKVNELFIDIAVNVIDE